jgi:hypothetical protein
VTQENENIYSFSSTPISRRFSPGLLTTTGKNAASKLLREAIHVWHRMHPDDTLVFPNVDGQLNGHPLRIVKRAGCDRGFLYQRE